MKSPQIEIILQEDTLTSQEGIIYLEDLKDSREDKFNQDFDKTFIWDELLKILNNKYPTNDHLSKITPREKEVIILRYYFGLYGSEVAKKLNICSGRVYQIEHRALRKLRHPFRARKLKPFYE